MENASPVWRIFETDQFAKDLEAISRSGHGKLRKELSKIVYPQLQRHPFFGPHIKKLKAYQPETWRYRIGSWRFFYEIDEAAFTVVMIAAAHRSSAY